MTDKNLKVLYGEMISKCWEDEEFKERLKKNPGEVLAEFGLPVEKDVEYKVIEAPKLVNYIVLPHEKLDEFVQGISKLLFSLVESGQTVIVPKGTETRILQNTKDTRYIVLHVAPDTLTATELDLLVGGGKNAVESVNYAVNCNVAAVVNVEAVANATTAMQAAEVVGVVVAAAIFI